MNRRTVAALGAAWVVLGGLLTLLLQAHPASRYVGPDHWCGLVPSMSQLAQCAPYWVPVPLPVWRDALVAAGLAFALIVLPLAARGGQR